MLYTRIFILIMNWKVLTERMPGCWAGGQKGGNLENLLVQEMWSSEEQMLVINSLDLQVIWLPLLHWSVYQGLPVRVQLVSAMAVAYINHQRGTRCPDAREEAGLTLF